MSFVFDQIDSIQRDRQEKDDALQRIRAWRHNKQQQPQQQSVEERQSGGGEEEEEEEDEGVRSVIRKEVEMVHPWPEWIELMERLLQQNYFDHRRFNEDRMVENVPAIDLEEFKGHDHSDDDGGSGFWKDWAAVCTACKNFGHDRFDLLKSLSRKDIQVLVGYGCPSLDGKVVYSAKLLRKLAHVNEGDVCSACSLRSSCKKGFLLVPKEHEARTIDVMRVLLTFGFDYINGSVKNRSLLKKKSLKTVVRKLLHEIVKLSAVPIDPHLPRPVIKKPLPKVKQTPPPPKKRVGRDDIEMKKGDWLCTKCDFMNFAKNAVCLQCDAKRPKRQLLPGEWECPECNFLNYRRNMACFHCECKRPQDEFMENQVNAKINEPKTGPPRNARVPNVSDAWNFDFDDNESDGADVAAFEFADPPRVTSINSTSHVGTTRRFDDDLGEQGRISNNHRREYISESDERNKHSHASRVGFDDFDDEEDDVESYEIDMASNNGIPSISQKKFSEFEDASESEDIDDFDHRRHNPSHKTSLPDSDDDRQGSDSEIDLSEWPKWKSSQYRGVSYGSDDDLDLFSDSDDIGRQDFSNDPRKGQKRVLERNTIIRQNRRYDGTSSSRNMPATDGRGAERNARGSDHNRFGDQMGHSRRGRDFDGRSSQRNVRGSDHNGSNGGMGNNRRGGYPGRYSRSSQGAGFELNHHQSDRGFNADDFGRSQGKRRGGDSRNFDRSNEVGDRPRSDDRPRRRIIER